MALAFHLKALPLMMARYGGGEPFGYNECGGDGGAEFDSWISMLSSGFQKRASFLLLRTMSSKSYLLQIPHTVTFC